MQLQRPYRLQSLSSLPASHVAGPRPVRRRAVQQHVATPLKEIELAPAEDEGACDLFLDRNGDAIRVMCCDYGFRTGSGRLYQESYGEVPKNVFELAADNFRHEFNSLRRSFRRDEYDDIQGAAAAPTVLTKVAGAAGGALVRGFASLDRALESKGLLSALESNDGSTEEEAGTSGSPDCKELRNQLHKLQLSDEKVWAREAERVAKEGRVPAPWYIKAPFWALCVVLDLFYANRPIQRFWVLETVARIPYFAYISILHLYESLGFWRAGAELRKIHFAEEWNELHHLQIMESLGGDQKWFDRFVAEHGAIAYYWLLIAFYLLSPRLAYMFSELVELHAADTYAQFVESNAEALKELPPPRVAAAYYLTEDLYMFDTFQTGTPATPEPRRPKCDTLYDVFCNIRDDELEHVKTMHACQDVTIARDLAERRQAQLGKGKR